MFGFKPKPVPEPTYCSKCRGINSNPWISCIAVHDGNVIDIQSVYAHKSHLWWTTETDYPIGTRAILVRRDNTIKKSSETTKAWKAGDQMNIQLTETEGVCGACGGEGTIEAYMRRKIQGYE